MKDLGHVGRFLEVIDRPPSNRLEGRCDASVGRKNHYAQMGLFFKQNGDERQTRHAGHAKVDDSQLRAVLLKELQGRFSIRSRPNLEAPLLESPGEALPESLVVIHNENGGGFHPSKRLSLEPPAPTKKALGPHGSGGPKHGVGTRSAGGYARAVDEAIQRILAHPILLAILVFLIGAVAYFLIKKLLKLALIFALGLVAVMGYFYIIDEEPPEGIKKIGKKLEEGATIGKEKLKKAGDKISKEIEKATKEGVEKGVDKVMGNSEETE